ncbi:hypothetical protein [Streptomyces hydrogenans]|uniref:Uncharacterized protein n=1 Tax=Streptomyces hydrogenans TaxID=1873719 RepID=A0ABQ3PQG3_9ACTN|nr:hypothetical protein [Streptomyces hydrogenans]GHG24641.1 hypothetical protein GCM10018784_42550 [Streptomyces hydrogenans]GHI27268.1 hypothetical protein Shyd_86390 [Streptomyces hydrogenans]
MSEEPVFVRSGWGSGRYVYNHRNPVGRALIVLAPLIALGGLFGMWADSTWSEGEIRDAVRKGVADLDGKRHYTSLAGDHGFLIAEAIRESGIGPGYGVEMRKEEDGGYTVSTEDTDAEYCVRVTLTPDKEPPVVFPGTEDLPPPGPDMLAFYVSHATFNEGACR